MPRILIVEDNDENRDGLARRLKRRGYDIVFATDGVQAVSVAATEKPDLILMDMNLPEMDGWEASRQIRASADSATIPIVALTAHALAGDRERALAAGCTDYHTKPVDFAKLTEQIETLLRAAAEPTTPNGP